MPYTPIPTLPTPPNSIARPGTFNADSDATFAALPSVVDAINDNLPMIDVAAQAAPAAVAAGAFKGKWSTLVGALAIPATVAYGPDDDLYMLLESVVNVTAEVPGVSGKWKKLEAAQRGDGGATTATDIILTAESAGALRIAPARYGITVTLPGATTLKPGAQLFALTNSTDFPVRICNAVGTLLGYLPPRGRVVVDLVASDTSAGVWGLGGADPAGVRMAQFTSVNSEGEPGYGIPHYAFQLSSTRRALLTFNGGWYVQDHDLTTGLLRTTLVSAADGAATCVGARISDTQMLVVSRHVSTMTTIEARVVTFGATVDVGAAVPATLADALTGFVGLEKVGTAYVVMYSRNGGLFAGLRAITVAGTTPTIGAELGNPGTGGSDQYPLALFGGETVGLAVVSKYTPANVYAIPITVSGTTITTGTQGSWSLSGSYGTSVALSSRFGDRFLVLPSVSSAPYTAAVVTLTGTTAAVATFNAAHQVSSYITMNSIHPVSAERCILGLGGGYLYSLTFSGGVASISAGINGSESYGAAVLRATPSRLDYHTFTYAQLAASDMVCRAYFKSFGVGASLAQDAYTIRPMGAANSGSANLFVHGRLPPPPMGSISDAFGAARRLYAPRHETVLNRFGACAYLLGGTEGVVCVSDQGARVVPMASIPFAFVARNGMTVHGPSASASPRGVKLEETDTYVVCGNVLYNVECVA